MNGFIVKAASILFLLFAFMGCSKMDFGKSNFETYIIAEGQHQSASQLRIGYEEELRFIVKFDSSAIYTTLDPVNQHSVNKLYGFSDCNTKHQENSARLGWRWLNGRLEILTYYYIDSERYFDYLTTLEIGNEYEVSIKITGRSYRFSINGATAFVKRGCTGNGLKYYLYPYFGGTETAPHDIRIKIKEL